MAFGKSKRTERGVKCYRVKGTPPPAELEVDALYEQLCVCEIKSAQFKATRSALLKLSEAAAFEQDGLGVE